MWTVPETGIHLFFCAAHPQKGVPRMANQVVAEVTVAAGFLPKPPPERMARWPPSTPRARAPLWPLSLHHAAADGGHPTTTSPTRRIPVRGGKRQMMRAWPGEEPGHKARKDGGCR